MSGSSFDDDGGGVRPDRPYRFDTSNLEIPHSGSVRTTDVDTSVEGEAANPRGRLGRAVQRLFFPDQWAKEQVLLDLIEDLPLCRSEHELARRTLDAVDQALRPEVVHLFVRRAVRFRLLRSTDQPTDGKTLLPAEFGLPGLAADWREPRHTSSMPDLQHDERAWLRSRQVRWVVPLCHPDPEVGLCGLLLLGARQGGYSPVQRDLLQAVAGRLALELFRQFERLRERLRERRGRGDWLLECPECGRCYSGRDYFCRHDDSTIEPTLLIERDVDGRYRLEQRLGSGGMGRVYRARDLEADSPVALKILTGGDRVALGRFANEARAGRRIRHPAVVEVADSGTLGRHGAYLVMEFIPGVTLREALKRSGAFDPVDLADWFDDVLAGVAAAHEVGVIHRDLKPENVMIVDTETRCRATVLDFGLAKMRASDSNPNTLTAAGMVLGTLAYMSPEQLQGDRVDHRSDLYTLGVLAAEALTGDLPFQAETLGEMLRKVADTPFRMKVRNTAQATVADILAKALEKAADDRYPDVASFRGELIPALRQCPKF
ncbi:MAG: serine/threonine protein kinase [Thermoanaerobaculia bacterium]|nr:serine/threonine protein kinase [Thermoanaerobaculia bacterium]